MQNISLVRSVSPVRESAMKTVGKPDAGNRHVRFDERGWETGRRSTSAPAPTLDSTCRARRYRWDSRANRTLALSNFLVTLATSLESISDCVLFSHSFRDSCHCAIASFTL